MAQTQMPIPDVIAEEIRRKIIEGELLPGERIREDEIGGAFGVSRVPVREALRRLEAEGFISLARHKGASVALPSETAALELMQVRRPLEVLAARLAAQARGGDYAERLREVNAQGLRSVQEHDNNHHPGLVDEFHELIVLAAGNSQLTEVLAQLRRKVRWVFAMDLESRAATAWHDHDSILSAVLDGDEDRAAELMDHHVSADESWYRSRLSGREASVG